MRKIGNGESWGKVFKHTTTAAKSLKLDEETTTPRKEKIISITGRREVEEKGNKIRTQENLNRDADMRKAFKKQP